MEKKEKEMEQVWQDKNYFLENHWVNYLSNQWNSQIENTCWKREGKG